MLPTKVLAKLYIQHLHENPGCKDNTFPSFTDASLTTLKCKCCDRYIRTIIYGHHRSIHVCYDRYEDLMCEMQSLHTNQLTESRLLHLPWNNIRPHITKPTSDDSHDVVECYICDAFTIPWRCNKLVSMNKTLCDTCRNRSHRLVVSSFIKYAFTCIIPLDVYCIIAELYVAVMELR